MRVEYTREPNAGCYSTASVTHCCDDMKDAWDGGAIHFGSDFPNFSDCDVNIWKWNCWPEGAGLDEYPIRFCPFCAEPVEVVGPARCPDCRGTGKDKGPPRPVFRYSDRPCPTCGGSGNTQ